MEGRVVPVATTTDVSLELPDIQAGALYERPSPYVGTYLLLRIDDPAQGRELVRRLLDIVNPATGERLPGRPPGTGGGAHHRARAPGGAPAAAPRLPPGGPPRPAARPG